MNPKITFSITILFLALFANAYAQQLTHQFTFSINDLEISEIDGYDHIALTDGSQLNGDDHTGKPQLPVKHFNLLLPAGARATGVNVIVGQETQLSGSFDLYPVQPPHYINFGYHRLKS